MPTRPGSEPGSERMRKTGWRRVIALAFGHDPRRSCDWPVCVWTWYGVRIPRSKR
jgi:hypothetical protein